MGRCGIHGVEINSAGKCSYCAAQSYRDSLSVLSIPAEWLPTPANINALPEPVRSYIADIETRCDPQYTMQQSVLLKDQVRQLEHKLQTNAGESRATIAEQGAEIARLKEVAAVVISNDPEDHKPVCCGGSIQDMCGCMGATPSSIATHELRQILEPKP